jgi:hypothetical protein
MDIYDVLILLAIGIFIFSTVNTKVILPRLRKKAAEAKRRSAGQDGAAI